MNKILISFLVSLMLSSLQANDEIFISPKVAIKMIDKKEITFISLDNISLKIKKSKYLDTKTLNSSNILGHMNCSPFYVCYKEVENYFSTLGITRNEALVIYDNSYGINAAMLYVVLESMGHKNVSILRGGVNDISQLDPNAKIYTNYLHELKNQDLNETSLNKHAENIKKITKKINILKPHLLLQESNGSNIEIKKSNYKVRNKSTDYLLSKEALRYAVKKVRVKESNIKILDACEMIDIVGNNNGSYVSGVKSLSWKKLVNKKKGHLKEKAKLQELFDELKLEKDEEHYVYCMSAAPKAFYVMMALRELGYSKVKVFSGDWNTWVGDIDE